MQIATVCSNAVLIDRGVAIKKIYIELEDLKNEYQWHNKRLHGRS